MFFEDATEEYTVVPISDATFEVAFDLVLEDDLRTLDSLQLGAAIELARPDLDVTFVCADVELVDVAASHNLSPVNPSS